MNDVLNKIIKELDHIIKHDVHFASANLHDHNLGLAQLGITQLQTNLHMLKEWIKMNSTDNSSCEELK